MRTAGGGHPKCGFEAPPGYTCAREGALSSTGTAVTIGIVGAIEDGEGMRAWQLGANGESPDSVSKLFRQLRKGVEGS